MTENHPTGEGISPAPAGFDPEALLEEARQSHTPAAFVDLYLDVERQISDVINGAGVTDTAGDVIRTIFSFIDDAGADVVDQLVGTTAANVKLAEQVKQLTDDAAALVLRSKSMQATIENLEELARTQQQQIAAHARSTANYQTSVIERDQIIADKQRMLRSQNEIIAGLHELRRREVGEISATMMSLLQTLNMSQVTITDERLAYAHKRFHGAHYSLTRHRDDTTRETIFKITKTDPQRVNLYRPDGTVKSNDEIRAEAREITKGEQA